MTKRILLFLGGIVHAWFVVTGSVGLWTLGVTLVTHAYSVALPGNLIYGAGQAVFILLAVPLGWFCMKKLGARRPWLAEIVALLVMLPVSAVVLTVGGLYSYSQRLDPDVALITIRLTYATGALLGGVLFAFIGRAFSRASTDKAHQEDRQQANPPQP